jgi:hypothetical protein
LEQGPVAIEVPVCLMLGRTKFGGWVQTLAHTGRRRVQNF